MIDVGWMDFLIADRGSKAFQVALKAFRGALKRGGLSFRGRRPCVPDGIVGYEIATRKTVTPGGWYHHPQLGHVVGHVHGWVDDGIVYVREIFTEKQYRKVLPWRHYSRWQCQALLWLTGAPWCDEYLWFTPNKKQAQKKARAAGLNAEQYHKFKETQYRIVRHHRDPKAIARIEQRVAEVWSEYGPDEARGNAETLAVLADPGALRGHVASGPGAVAVC